MILRNVLGLTDYKGETKRARRPVATASVAELAGFETTEASPKLVRFMPVDQKERALIKGAGTRWVQRRKRVIGTRVEIFIRPAHHVNDNLAVWMPVERLEFIK